MFFFLFLVLFCCFLLKRLSDWIKKLLRYEMKWNEIQFLRVIKLDWKTWTRNKWLGDIYILHFPLNNLYELKFHTSLQINLAVLLRNYQNRVAKVLLISFHHFDQDSRTFWRFPPKRIWGSVMPEYSDEMGRWGQRGLGLSAQRLNYILGICQNQISSNSNPERFDSPLLLLLLLLILGDVFRMGTRVQVSIGLRRRRVFVIIG